MGEFDFRQRMDIGGHFTRRKGREDRMARVSRRQSRRADVDLEMTFFRIPLERFIRPESKCKWSVQVSNLRILRSGTKQDWYLGPAVFRDSIQARVFPTILLPLLAKLPQDDRL